jgi:iron complex outermembrane receptor protein
VVGLCCRQQGCGRRSGAAAGALLALAAGLPAAQPPGDSRVPGADALLPVHVITAEEIRQSGATSIAEALRLAPGLDIVTTSVRSPAVAVRGLVGDPADAMVLVMVDGRVVNWDAFGTVLWEFLPVPLAAVERIEILRSPGSSLYGPNACAGVINILTRPPERRQGLEVSLSGGEYGTLIGAALYGVSGERFGLGLSAELNQTDEWRGSGEAAGEVMRLNGSLQYRYGEQGRVGLTLGRAHTDRARFPVHPAVGALAMSGNVDHALLEATYRAWLCRASFRQEDFSGWWEHGAQELHWLSSVIDIDLQHSFAAGRANTVGWGLTYRAVTVAPSDLVPSFRRQHLCGVFVNDELRLGERWGIGLGVRYDYHPLAGSNVSSRGALRFSPARDHTLRLSAATGFRNPSLLDSYLEYSVRDTALPGGSPSVVVTDVAGNRDLEAQKLFGVELGYRGLLVRRLSADVALFYRYHTGLYRWRVDTAWAFPADSLGLERGVDDGGRAHGLGGEIDLRYRLTDWLTLTGNYSLQELLAAETDSLACLRCVPQNKCNVGFSASLAGFRIGAWLHWSQATTWEMDDGRGGRGTVELPSRLLVNARLAYGLKNAEVSAAVFDLFDRKYYEYPPDAGGEAAGGDELRQKVTVQLTCRF